MAFLGIFFFNDLRSETFLCSHHPRMSSASCFIEWPLPSLRVTTREFCSTKVYWHVRSNASADWFGHKNPSIELVKDNRLDSIQTLRFLFWDLKKMSLSIIYQKRTLLEINHSITWKKTFRQRGSVQKVKDQRSTEVGPKREVNWSLAIRADSHTVREFSTHIIRSTYSLYMFYQFVSTNCAKITPTFSFYIVQVHRMLRLQNEICLLFQEFSQSYWIIALKGHILESLCAQRIIFEGHENKEDLP